MERFSHLLLSALLLATTSYDVLGTNDTNNGTEAIIPDCSEPGSSSSCEPLVLATNVTINGTEAVPECLCVVGEEMMIDGTNDTVNGTELLQPVCASQGKFPLCDLCPEKYYECNYVNGSNSTLHLDISACPPGTIFNVSSQDCANSSSVTTTNLPETVTVSWQMEDVISGAESVCRIVKSIDDYDTTTITTLPLRRGLPYQEMFNAYITTYNKDLEVAQSHMRSWRKGNSIVDDIRRMYYEAKGYENEFDRMYNISKTRMKDAEEESYRRVQSLEQQIEGLKDNIEMKEAEYAAEATDELRLMKKMEISYHRQQLTEKEKKLKASTPMALKLEEMSTFLGFIRSHASEVMEMATNSSERIKQLYENIAMNNNTFSDYAVQAEDDLLNLREEEQRLKSDIQKTRDDLVKLEDQKRQLNIEEDNLIKDNEEIYANINSLREEIENKKTLFEKLKATSCRAANILWKLYDSCGDILKHNKVEYEGLSLEEELEDNKKKQRENNDAITKLVSKHEDINNQMSSLRDNIPPNERRIDKIKYETQAFEMFIPDLKNMAHGIPSVQKNLKELEIKIRTVEIVFQLFNEDIMRMINFIETAETDNDRDETMENIIEDLDSHQIRIDQSSKKIINMRLCTRLS